MLMDADLVELEEAAGGLGDHVEKVCHLRPGSPPPPPHDLETAAGGHSRLLAAHIQQVGRHETTPTARCRISTVHLTASVEAVS